MFPAERGGPIRRSNFTPSPDPSRPRAVVEGLRFHDLRHTAATLAVAAGASTRELMVRIMHLCLGDITIPLPIKGDK